MEPSDKIGKTAWLPHHQRCHDIHAYWQQIALTIKEQAGWRCAKCDLQCLRPGDDITGLTKSERTKITLTVHHHNRMPEDNRPENLIALKPQLSPGLSHSATVKHPARSAIV